MMNNSASSEKDAGPNDLMNNSKQNKYNRRKSRHFAQGWKALYENNTSDRLTQSLRYYKSNIARIEIVNSLNEIQVLYFPKPPLTKYLSSSTKQRFLETVNRDSANDKINGLLYKQEDFIDEMQHYQFLTKKIKINFNKVYSLFRSLVLLLVFILNFFILFDEFEEECSECESLLARNKQCICDEKTYKTQFRDIIGILGWIVLVLNAVTFFLWAILQLKLDSRKFERHFQQYMLKKHRNGQKSRQNKNMELKLQFTMSLISNDMALKDKIVYNIQKAQHFMFHSYFFYLLCYAGVAFAGIYFSRLCFCILLLDIIDRSIILKNVIKSITVNFRQLGMTGILGVVIIFIYSMLAFYSQYVRSTMETLEYGEPICDTPIMCFMFVVNVGLRAGGGVGEPLIQPNPYSADDYYSRFFFDLTFFLVIIVIWMNIIFGIIIDTFAALRDEKTQKDQDAKNKCFICSLERTVFEKQGLSFDNHSTKQHGVWNYLYYIVYLREKDQIDYNGTESYVAEKIKNDDISWFPIGVAIALDKVEDTEDQQMKKMMQNIDNNLSIIAYKYNQEMEMKAK